MTDDPDDPLDAVAEEFAERLRAGGRPDPEEYVRRHPDRAAEVREVLSGVALLERLKPTPAGAAGRPPARLGEYRPLHELGRGGMGVVYEAVHEPLGRRVALKVLPGGRPGDAAGRERFLREAKAAARLHHTHIVPVFGAGEADGVQFIAMQLIDGRPLDRVVAPPAGRERARWAARLAADAADALDHAHARGVLHRDVKPSNLLVDAAGTVWVTDFGVAKLLEAADLTATGEVVGTLRYMPPERLSGQSDARGDVYGLGVTLYEVLAGRPAFPHTSPSLLVKRITDADLPPLRDLAPGLPADLETVVLTAMARDPRHRYATAGALAADLRRFLDDRPVLARRTGPAGRLVRWGRRNPGLAALTAAVAGLLLVVAGVSSAALAVTVRARAAEVAHRQQAEEAATLALDALNRTYERFAPARLVAAPPADPLDPPRPAVLPPTVVPVLEDLLATYGRIADAGRGYPNLLARVAEAQHRMGDLHARLGRHEPAVAAYRQALDLYADLPAGAVRVRRARAGNECGRLLSELHRSADARAMHEGAAAVLQAAPPDEAGRPEVRYELAAAWFALDRRDMLRDGPPPPPPGGFGDGPPPPPPDGFDRPPPPDGPGGPPRAGRAVELLDGLVSEHPGVPEYRHLLACCLADRPGQEETAAGLLRALVREHPAVPDYRFDLCQTLLRPGPGDRDTRRLGEAVALAAGLAATHPEAPGFAALHARALDRLGGAEFDAGRPLAAEATLQQAVGVQARLVEQHPAVGLYRVWLGLMERSLARPVAARGDLADARRLLQAGIGRVAAEFRADPSLAGARPFLGMAWGELADVQDRAGDPAGAAQSRREAEAVGGR